MSTQDTTLQELVDAEMAAYSNGEYAKHSDTRDRLFDFARAAIAAQAAQPTCVWSVESKTFRVLCATPADAEKYMASLPITVSGGMSISAVPVIGAQQAQGVPADWLHLKPYGYAPGNYMSKCLDCGSTPVMDKRATRCRPCAETAFGKAPQAEPQAHKSAQGCQHKRYSLDKQEQVGRCIDCGAEGRMVFVVQAPSQAEPPKSATSRDCPYCHYTGTAHCGDVADKIRTLGGDLGYCSNAQVYGNRERQDEIPDCAVEINRLRNVIQAACTGGLGHMIERWKALFPDAPVPTVHAVQAPAPQAEPQPEREPERKPLPDAQIEKLREQTFSTSNPFCPCDSKTMRKAVWAAERAHGIGTKGGDKR